MISHKKVALVALVIVLILLPFKEYGQEEMLRPFYHVYALRTDSSQCGTADVSNYPLCVQLTKSYLAKTKTGEDSVMNQYKGTPYDVEFSTTPGFEANNLLNWEIEYWDSTGGSIKAWVKLPNLTHATGQVIYMGVGNANITSFQGGSAGSVWNSSYKAVYHCKDGTTLSGNDATNATNNMTIVGASATTGNIDGGASFNGSSNYLYTLTNPTTNTSGWCISAWVYPASVSSQACMIVHNGRDNSTTDGNGYGFGIGDGGGDAGTNLVGLFSGVAWFGTSYSFPTNNTWYLVVMSNTSGTTTLYSNASSKGTSGTTPTTPTEVSTFGAERYTGTPYYFFNGRVDEVRFMNAGITTSQITADYNSQKSGSTFIILTQIY